MDFNKLCILGLGYIGLPTASTFATHGLQVIGIDVNPHIVKGLQKGQLHLHEPGLRTLVQAALRSGNLIVCDKPETADAFIIAVPTPFHEDKRADLQYVRAAAEAVVPHLRRGNLVVLESTSPPRTTVDLVAPILERSGLKAGRDFYLAYSPERVLPGQILRELIENARVIGGVDLPSAEAGRDLYTIFVRGEIVLTDATTAEMVKLMENTYRDVNIAVANEFSRLAEHFGVDVWEAIQLANRHPRVRILNPGPGVGGHCISVDPWFFVMSAPHLTTLIRTAREVNDAQPEFVVDGIKRLMGDGHVGRRVTLLGLAYKADVDDLRESPAVRVAHLLQEAGMSPVAYEPYRTEDQEFQGVPLAPSLRVALEGSDVVVLLVGHKEFKPLSASEMAGMTPARLILDATHTWDAELWRRAGFTFTWLGDGSTK